MDQTFTKQVVAYLTNKKQELEETIQHIDKTIAFLYRLHAKHSAQSDNEVQQTMSLRRKTKPKLTPESVFSPKFKLDRKIAYVLTKIGNGFKDDIVAELYALQPELDIHKLGKFVAVRLSYLLKIGAIQGRKISRRYEYSLFE